MRALFIQHDPGSQPGLVGAALARRGYDVDLLEMSESIHDGTWHGAFPDPRDYDLVVPLGAIWSLYDRDKVRSWIDRELALLRAADATSTPVLGICFGAQALAAAHGGRVEPSPRKEIGLTTIESDDPDLVPEGPWMQWHGDCFTVPAGGIELARNDIGPQAFRLRRNLGVQFHPEVDVSIVTSWVDLGGDLARDDLDEAGSSAEEVLAGILSEADRLAADVDRLVDRFLADVAQA